MQPAADKLKEVIIQEKASREELEEKGFSIQKISLGEIHFEHNVSDHLNQIRDILIKIGWFRNDGVTIRFRLFKSDDNGVSWITYPNLDLPIESDGYTLIAENLTEYEISLIFDLRKIQAISNFHYYVVPNITTEGNLILNK